MTRGGVSAFLSANDHVVTPSTQPIVLAARDRKLSPGQFQAPGGRLARLIVTYSVMLLRAAFKAASGLARSLVASSNAAFIELQNFPI